MTSTQPTLRRRVRRRARRGSGLVWFLLVVLPLLFFGMVLSLDTAYVAAQARDATNVAESAAISGANQFLDDTATLDTSQADSIARSTFTQGAPWYNGDWDVDASSDSVTVHGTLEVDGTLFLRMLSAWFLGDASRTVEVDFERTANVCIPGESEPTDGHCTRPIRY